MNKSILIFLLLFCGSYVFSQKFEMISTPKNSVPDKMFQFNNKLYYSLYFTKDNRYELWVTNGELNDSKLVGILESQISETRHSNGTLFIICKGERYTLKKLPPFYCIDVAGNLTKLDIGSDIKLTNQFNESIYEKYADIKLFDYNYETKETLIVVSLKNSSRLMNDGYQSKGIYLFNPNTKQVSKPFNGEFSRYGKFFECSAVFNRLIFFTAWREGSSDAYVYSIDLNKSNSLTQQMKGEIMGAEVRDLSTDYFFQIKLKDALKSGIYYILSKNIDYESKDYVLRKYADADYDYEKNFFMVYGKSIFFINNGVLYEGNLTGYNKLQLYPNDTEFTIEDHFILHDTLKPNGGLYGDGSLYIVTSIKANDEYKRCTIFLYSQNEKKFYYHNASKYLPYLISYGNLNILAANGDKMAFFEGQANPSGNINNRTRELLIFFNKSKIGGIKFDPETKSFSNTKVDVAHFWNNGFTTSKIIVIFTDSTNTSKPYVLNTETLLSSPLEVLTNGTKNYWGSLWDKVEIEYHNKLYFTVGNLSGKSERFLWCSDGTTMGTKIVSDKFSLTDGRSDYNFDQMKKSVVYKGKLYFIGRKVDDKKSERLQIWNYSDM